MAKGQARVLLSQLAQKLGPLEKTVVARIRRARSEQLEGLAERILTAASVDEVFARQLSATLISARPQRRSSLCRR